VVALVLAVAKRDGNVAPVAQPAREAKPPAAILPASSVDDESDSEIIDDGHTMWASPTKGPPLVLANLPPGVELILALRPAALLAHPEGEKILAALGPWGAEAVRAAEQATGKPLRDIDQLLVGWQVDRDGQWHATVLDTPTDGAAPPLPRDMERLVARTDATRHATLLFRPHILLDDNSRAFSGPMTRLREALRWLFGDGLSTAAVSLHWDDDFFVELVGIPTLDVATHQMAESLAERVEEASDRVEEFVVGLDPSPYGRRVVARFPGMVRILATYTRPDDDGEAVTLRCYLPSVAGHNLLMGAELTLSEAEAARRGMIE